MVAGEADTTWNRNLANKPYSSICTTCHHDQQGAVVPPGGGRVSRCMLGLALQFKLLGERKLAVSSPVPRLATKRTCLPKL